MCTVSKEIRIHVQPQNFSQFVYAVCNVCLATYERETYCLCWICNFSLPFTKKGIHTYPCVFLYCNVFMLFTRMLPFRTCVYPSVTVCFPYVFNIILCTRKYRRVPADVLVYILLISIRVNPKRERISLKLSNISGSNFSKISEIVMLFKYSEIFCY